jgi:hypothetical protein
MGAGTAHRGSSATLFVSAVSWLGYEQANRVITGLIRSSPFLSRSNGYSFEKQSARKSLPQNYRIKR